MQISQGPMSWYYFIVWHNTQAIHKTVINSNYARTRQTKITPWVSSEPLQFWWTKCDAAITWLIFSRIITTDTYLMAHLSGRCMRRPLWVENLINIFRRYRFLTTDTPWLVCKGDTWGDLCEFNFWLMYHITTGSSQQTPHGSSERATHGASPASSNSDRCIISLQDLYSRHPTNCMWGQLWGVLYEFKFWLIYHITTGSSQQTHHGPPAKAIHVASPVILNSD